MTTEARLAENHWRVPAETRTAAGSVLLRRGARWPFQAALVLVLTVLGASLLGAVGSFGEWLGHRVEVLIVLGGIGCWRWGWFSTQTIRAAIYRYWTFPRLRRQANEAVA